MLGRSFPDHMFFGDPLIFFDYSAAQDATATARPIDLP